MTKKIIIVDDVQKYLSSLSRALSGEYEVVKAASFEEAKERMDATISFALVDVRLSEEDMANRDGILLLAWLKENYPEVKVIIMSAYRDFDAVEDAANLGAKYMRKPINLRELKDLMKSLTGA
jgi:DNA-binding NtrC family response regulator